MSKRDPVERRLVGGFIWRDELRRVIRAEEEELDDIDELMRRTADLGISKRLARLYRSKVEKITILNELLRYSDPGGGDN
jgi:hypothetical protein